MALRGKRKNRREEENLAGVQAKRFSFSHQFLSLIASITLDDTASNQQANDRQMIGKRANA
jgi:hypothetical protein